MSATGLRFWLRRDASSGEPRRAWPNARLDITQAGGTYVDRPVVVDGNLVTARTWHDNTWLLKEFVRMLKS